MIPMIPKFSLSRFASAAGFKEVRAVIEMPFFSSSADSSNPVASVAYPIDAKYSTFALFSCRKISSVLFVRPVKQVAPSVVRFIVVVMVNLERPFTGHIKPREAVNVEFPIIDADDNIAIAVRSKNVTRAYLSAPSDKRSKYASFRVVMNQFFESFLSKCNISISHAIASFSRVIRLVGVSAPIDRNYSMVAA